jgi:hypothetical protein
MVPQWILESNWMRERHLAYPWLIAALVARRRVELLSSV